MKIFKSNTLNVKIVYSIISGAFIAFFYLFKILGVGNFSSNQLAFIGLYLFLFFFIIDYLIVFVYTFPRLQKLGYSEKFRYLFLFITILLGCFFYFAAPKKFIPASKQELKIIANGNKNENALGNEVRLISVIQGSSHSIGFDKLEKTGNWQEADGTLLTYPSPKSTITWITYDNQPITLTFISHPWSGTVRIMWNGHLQDIDLYNASSTNYVVELKPQQSNNGWLIVCTVVSTGVTIGLIIFLITTFVFVYFRENTQLVLKRYFKVNYIISYVFIPVSILALYSGSFEYLSSKLLPEGVNYVFTNRLWKFLLILLIVVCVTAIVIFKLDENSKVKIKKSTGKVSINDFLFLLLPITTVVQYIIINRSTLSLLDSIFVVAFFIIFSGIYIFIIPNLFGCVSSTRLLIIIGLAFVITIVNMASLSQYFHWFEKGSLKIQFGYFFVTLLVSWFLYSIKNKKALSLVMIVYLVANSGIQFLTNQDGVVNETSPLTTENQLQSMITGKTPVFTPNIYLLVYDSYVCNETMLGYGIDNNHREAFLTKNGFVIYPHTYSIGADTISSMSRVLNASNSVSGSRKEISGDGAVQNSLKLLNYMTFGLFPYDYMFRGIGSSYEFSIPKSSKQPYAILISAILIGEFKYDIGFYDELSHTQYVSAKQSVLSDVSNERVFIYAHSNFPAHSQISGTCLPNEIESFKERLLIANDEMRQDVETIIKFDPDSIIIIAGDHGPYLTKNCSSTGDSYDISEISRLDIQDRYGSFLAIRWPTDDYEKFDDITVLQDIFLSIFAYLFNDSEFLKLKVKPEIAPWSVISGVVVKNGIIYGGINDGEPLYLSGK